MINLLPPAYVKAIHDGRINNTLRRWLISSAAATAGLLLILVSGWLYFDHQAKNLTRDISVSQAQLQAQNLTQVKKDASDITGDVKVINQVLSREISFSGLMQAIGKVMPPGTILSGLTLTKVNGAIDLSASARDYKTADQIAVNLGDPKNGLFSSVDIININCGGSANAYPCSGTFKALFNKDAQKQFLSATKGPK